MCCDAHTIAITVHACIIIDVCTAEPPLQTNNLKHLITQGHIKLSIKLHKLWLHTFMLEGFMYPLDHVGKRQVATIAHADCMEKTVTLDNYTWLLIHSAAGQCCDNYRGWSFQGESTEWVGYIAPPPFTCSFAYPYKMQASQPPPPPPPPPPVYTSSYSITAIPFPSAPELATS